MEIQATMKTYHADIERNGKRTCQRFQSSTLEKAKRNALRLAKGAKLFALYKEDDEGNWDLAWSFEDIEY